MICRTRIAQPNGAVNDGLTNTCINALAINRNEPAVLYAATAGGGVFKTTDGGDHWHAFSVGLANPFVMSLAVDPQHAEIVYAGTTSGVFVTRRLDRHVYLPLTLR